MAISNSLIFLDVSNDFEYDVPILTVCPFSYWPFFSIKVPIESIFSLLWWEKRFYCWNARAKSNLMQILYESAVRNLNVNLFSKFFIKEVNRCFFVFFCIFSQFALTRVGLCRLKIEDNHFSAQFLCFSHYNNFNNFELFA